MESNKYAARVQRDKRTAHSAFLRWSAKVKARGVREYPPVIASR